jgi:transcriptional regulator with XRE-family HTH domain
MTGRQLRNMLKREGFTQSQAAQLIGISDRQMRRYVASRTPIPKVVECALRYVSQVALEAEKREAQK